MKKLTHAKNMSAVLSLVALLLAAAPGSARSEKDDDWQRLSTKKELYLNQGFLLRNDFAWPRIEQSACDALKFASLYAVSGATWVDPLLAEDTSEPGSFFRRPERDCLKDILDDQGNVVDRQDNGSKSSVSRDMFLGLLHWILATDNFPVIDRVIHYGLSHSNSAGGWVMGVAATLDRAGNRVSDATHTEWLEATVVDGPLQATFCQLWKHLNDKRGTDALPDPNWLVPCLSKYNESYVVEGFFVKGYITHLHALHILLRMKMLNEVSWQQITLLRHYAVVHPQNALFQAMLALAFTGPIVDPHGTPLSVPEQERRHFKNQAVSAAAATLLNRLDGTVLAGHTLFPDHRLPTENDRASFYLFQRDLLQNGVVNDDWLPKDPPAADGKSFEAIDFLFSMHVLTFLR